jgi:hypothetical protein
VGGAVAVAVVVARLSFGFLGDEVFLLSVCCDVDLAGLDFAGFFSSTSSLVATSSVVGLKGSGRLRLLFKESISVTVGWKRTDGVVAVVSVSSRCDFLGAKSTRGPGEGDLDVVFLCDGGTSQHKCITST